MRYTLMHRGVALGHVELAFDGDLGAGLLEPLAGYVAVQPVLRAGAAATAELTALRQRGEPTELAEAALARQRGLEAELRLVDRWGATALTRSIELSDPGVREPPRIAVLAVFALPPAAEPGAVAGRTASGGHVA